MRHRLSRRFAVLATVAAVFAIAAVGAVAPSAMDLTLERMTQNPIGDLPLPVCPPRS